MEQLASGGEVSYHPLLNVSKGKLRDLNLDCEII